MSYYDSGYRKRYNYRRYNMKKRRNTSPSKNPELYLLALVLCSFGLYTLGYSTYDIVQLLVVATSVVFVVYLLVRSLFIDWRDGRAIFRAWKTRNMKDIDAMTGVQFERHVAQLLKRQGYRDVRLTEYYDLGVDIIARKDGVTWGIQTKRYSNPVRADAVRQVYAALSRYKCDRAMVVTNSTFSSPAKILADDNRIILIDRYALAKMV